MRKDIYRNSMAVAKSRIDDSHSELVARSRFLPRTTEYVIQIPGSVLYECQPEIQLGAAAFAGFAFAVLLY